MIWITEEVNGREQEILNGIRRYLEDYRCDTFSDGYEEAKQDAEALIDEAYQEGMDHAWDEARNKGYDEGWEDACQYILDKVLQQHSGFVVTPKTHMEAAEWVEQNAEHAYVAFLGVNNFYISRIKDMKVDNK